MKSFPSKLYFLPWIFLSFTLFATQINSLVIQPSENKQFLPILQNRQNKVALRKQENHRRHQSLFENIPFMVQFLEFDDMNNNDHSESHLLPSLQTGANDKTSQHIRCLSIIETNPSEQNSGAESKPNPATVQQNFSLAQKEVSRPADIIQDYNSKKVPIQNSQNIQQVTRNQIKTNIPSSVFLNINLASFLIDNPSQQYGNYAPINSPINDFPEVILSHEVPDVFLQGTVKSKELTNSADSKVVTVMFTDEFLSEKTVYTEKLTSNSGDFQISIEVPKRGKYRIGIFYGLTGSPSSRVFTVVSEQLQNKVQTTISENIDRILSAKFEVVQNNLLMNLDPTIKKKDNSSFLVFFLKFNQRFEDEVTLIYSNLVQSNYSIKIPYYKFANFYETITYVQIYVGESKTLSAVNLTDFFRLIGNQSFFATYHQFNEFKPQILQLSSQPQYHITQMGTGMNITGVTRQQIRNEIVVLEPAKTFKQYSINIDLKQTDKISINSKLNVEFIFDKQGTYIIEINHADGYAVLNQPIYVGYNIYPLLPDFEDLKPYISDKNANIARNIDEIKAQILELVNQKRKQFDQGPLILDLKLGTVAQKHADDMLRRNYISHYSPQAVGPIQRAKSGGIIEQVSQNIALNSGIQDAHYRLSRSNIHLRNMVRPYWERLGLVITINSQGAYIIVQEYSTRDFTSKPFTSTEINSLKTQIMKALMQTSSTIKSVNETLSTDVTEYARIKILGQSSQYASLGDFLRGTKRYKKWIFSNLKVTYKSEGLIDVIKIQTTIMPKNNLYTQIGMSLQYSEGFLVLFFAFI